MFAVSPTLDLAWIPRRPRRAAQLELAGWRFLPLTRELDAADKDLLGAATGLSAISPGYAEYASREWWVAYLKAYLRHGDPVRAASEAPSLR
jgi:hypothetical protein